MSYIFTGITEDIAQNIFEETQSARLLIENIPMYNDYFFQQSISDAYESGHPYPIVIDEKKGNYLSSIFDGWVCCSGEDNAPFDCQNYYFFYSGRCYMFYTYGTELLPKNDLYFFSLTPPPNESQEYSLFAKILADMLTEFALRMKRIDSSCTGYKSIKFSISIDEILYNLLY